jgi:DNA-binding transcriptional LysR family regulator
MLHSMQQEDNTIAHGDIPEHLRNLARLYPDYDVSELEEAHENLMRFLNRGWDIVVRLQKEGKLDEVFDRHQAKFYDKGTKVDSYPNN